ncbi:MAG: hypothetical protein JKY70_13890 [Mucilaginibacter sp.]|nr:hypothetical protein [Mucilaginibacter sp.]
MRTKKLIEIITALLILLYVYTAASKLIAFNDFRMQMRMQVLPAWLKDILIWLLPIGELLLAGLLLFSAYRKTGLWISGLLLTAFTIYVSLALLNVLNRVPCSCGGVLRTMGWTMHFWFNLFFLLLNIYAINLTNRERRNASS